MAESLVKQVGSNFQPSAFSKSDDYKAKLRADS